MADLESISHGQKFVTKNGTDYGVPQAGSTVIVTSPNSGKTTYVMDAEGIWVVTEDISYSAVVANPSDAATAKLEKLKVNDTTYANWTESEIKALAGGSGGKLYGHTIIGTDTEKGTYYFIFYSTFATEVDLYNIRELNDKIPFGILYNINTDGAFVFVGVCRDPVGGPPGQIVFNIAGVSNSVMCTYERDIVIEA